MPLRPLPPSSPMEFQTWWHEERSVPLRRLLTTPYIVNFLVSRCWKLYKCAMWTHVACYCYVHPYPTPKQKTPAANVHLMSSGHLSYLLCKPSIYKISAAAASISIIAAKVVSSQCLQFSLLPFTKISLLFSGTRWTWSQSTVSGGFSWSFPGRGSKHDKCPS